MGQKLFQCGKLFFKVWQLFQSGTIISKLGCNNCIQSFVLSRELLTSTGYFFPGGHLVVEKKYLKNCLYELVVFDYGGGKEAMLVIT